MRIITISLIVSCGIVHAAEQHIDCPDEIKRDTIQITSAPAGWTPFYLYEYEPGLPLNGAGVMWGPPSTMTAAKPSWSRRIAGDDVIAWTELGGTTSTQKWIACYYGDHGQNDAILSRPIDSDTTECRVTYQQKRKKTIDVMCK